MGDVPGTGIRRGVRLPRVTSAPAADLFSTAGVRPVAALETLDDPVVPEPEQEPVSTPAVWDVPRHAVGRRPRTGRVLVTTLVGAALLVTPLIVWSAQGRSHHRAGSTAARPGGGSLPSATPRGSASATATPTPHPTPTVLGERTGAGGTPGPARSGGAAEPKFSLVAGPGCGGGGYTRVGFYTDGRSGWLAGSDGSSGGGCDGRFDALPMSGEAGHADPTLFAQWTFDPGSRHKCTVAVYTPDSGSEVYVGGRPAHFSVHQVSGGASLAGFHIDQPASRGRWVSGASFTAGGPFYVRLDNTGQDWTGNRKTYAHLAAGRVRATCG
jgi:hypothetical protein